MAVYVFDFIQCENECSTADTRFHGHISMLRLWRRRRATRPLIASSSDVRAVVDFGASGARAAMVRLTPNGVEVLGVGAVAGPSGVARPGQAMRREEIAVLVENALHTAEQATVQYVGDLPKAADEAIVGLTGSYLKADSGVTYFERDTPVAPIYEAEIHDALYAAQNENLQLLAQQAKMAKIRRTVVASQLVAAMSVREEVGQAHRLPDITRGVPGLAGDRLAVAICNVTYPRKGLEVVVQVLDDVNLALTDAVPLAQAVAAALPLPDAILIDIGQEHTEISLAEAGTLSALISITTGGQFFTRHLAHALRISESAAEAAKQQFVRSIGQEGGAQITTLLQEATDLWLKAIEQALLYLSGDVALPPRFYLFGGGSFMPGLFERLRQNPWARRLPFDHDPTVERLLPYHLRGILDPRGQLAHPSQVGIAALAAWVGRETPMLQHYLETITTEVARPLGLR